MEVAPRFEERTIQTGWRQHALGFVAFVVTCLLSTSLVMVYDIETRGMKSSRHSVMEPAGPIEPGIEWQVVSVWTSCGFMSDDPGPQSDSGYELKIPGFFFSQRAYLVRESFGSNVYARAALLERLAYASEPMLANGYPRGRFLEGEQIVARFDVPNHFGQESLPEVESCGWARLWIDGTDLYSFYAPTQEIVNHVARLEDATYFEVQ